MEVLRSIWDWRSIGIRVCGNLSGMGILWVLQFLGWLGISAILKPSPLCNAIKDLGLTSSVVQSWQKGSGVQRFVGKFSISGTGHWYFGIWHNFWELGRSGFCHTCGNGPWEIREMRCRRRLGTGKILSVLGYMPMWRFQDNLPEMCWRVLIPLTQFE